MLDSVRERYSVPFVLYDPEEREDSGVVGTATDYVRDSDLVAHRVRCEARRWRAERSARRTSRISDVVRRVSQVLVGASTRERIEHEVCEYLTESDTYVFAWIGESEDDEILPRAWGGRQDGYLNEVSVTADQSETGRGPGGSAVRTREMQIVHDVSRDPEFEPWREDALERGYRSVAAVPLVHDDNAYGILVVYAAEPYAFDDDEQEFLAELGETLAYAINAVEMQRDAEVFREAVEQAGHAIYITDRGGNIEYVNPAFEEITGYSAEEAVGENMRVLESSENDRAVYVDLWDTVLSGDVWQGEMVNQRKNGGKYYTKQTVAPVKNDRGRIERFVTVTTDITERKRRQQRLQVLNRVLRHNLRNHMNVIVGYADMLMEEAREPGEIEEIKQTGEELVELSDKARNIEETLRKGSRPQRPKELVGILERKKEEFEREHPEIQLSLDAPEEAWVVADNRLGNVVHEVIGNSVYHNDRDPEVEIGVLETDGRVEVEVRDNGPGIPEHERQVMGMGRETPLLHGSGLGLWLVNWIVDSYGGDIEIRDNEPRGSVVRIKLLPAQVSREVS